MRVANNSHSAQPLSDGRVIPAGVVADVDDAVGSDAIERGAVTAVEGEGHKHVLDLSTHVPSKKKDDV